MVSEGAKMEDFTFSTNNALTVVIQDRVVYFLIQDRVVYFLPKIRFFILPNRPLDDWEEGAGEDCGAQRTGLSDEVLDELFEPKGK